MTDARWAELKTQSWGRPEQDEVTAYVEEMRTNDEIAATLYENAVKQANTRIAELEEQMKSGHSAPFPWREDEP